MRIIERLEDINECRDSAIALGNFDGIHKGHVEVICSAVNTPDMLHAVFTFSANPHGGRTLVTAAHKERIMESLGVEVLYRIDFSDVREMEPEEFFEEVLIEKCCAKKIVCGEDFRFGKSARGDTKLLKELCDKTDIELEIANPVMENGEMISSTEIRKYIKSGEIKKANAMLGRPFDYSLEVIHGNHIGTGLGMPTINQALPENFILPKFGVYASFVKVDGKLYYGVTNIGVKPTVGSDRVLSETWMPEFKGDLYGRRIHVYLLEFIRPEEKFPSIEVMKNQVLKDADTAHEICLKTESEVTKIIQMF